MSSANAFLLTAGIVLLFLIAFPLWWMFVVWIISRFGWNRLAQRYATDLATYGDSFGGQSISIGLSRYRGTVTITMNQDGLFAEPMWMFRVGHRRLFIPWAEMHDPRPATFRIWPQIKVSVGYPEIASISLPQGLLEEGPEGARRLFAAQGSRAL